MFTEKSIDYLLTVDFILEKSDFAVRSHNIYMVFLK